MNCTALSQEDRPFREISPDTSDTGVIKRLKKEADEEARSSIKRFNDEKEDRHRDRLIENLQTATLKAKNYLKRPLDTVKILTDLGNIKAWYKIAEDGVLINKGTAQTQRNLVTSSKLLTELLNRVNKHKAKLDDYERNLFAFRYNIDSLNSDTVLYDFPEDSIALNHYLQKIVVTLQPVSPTDSALKTAISQTHHLQTQINLEANRLSSGIEELDNYQKELSDDVTNRDFPNIYDPSGFSRPFSEIIHFSQIKGELLFVFYAQHHIGKILLLIALVIAVTMFLRSLKKMLVNEKAIRSDMEGQLVIRYPFLSAIVIVLSLFQFIFPDPPFVFNIIFWALPAIALTIIFRGFIKKYWMIIWLTLLILFLAACGVNLILQASRTERWGMLILSIIGLLVGAAVFVLDHRKELKVKLILWFIGLTVLFEFISVVANIYGRYNFAKSMFICGYFNVIIGIVFLWTARLINEGLSIASRVYTRQERKLFYVNFERVGGRAPVFLFIFLITGWFILVGRNFYAFRLISEPLWNFFIEQRTIGQYSFSISNILIFFGILISSIIISKIVSYFATDKHQVHSSNQQAKKSKLGTWLLLVRISIISLGLFLALAASGFPMDRITIILGALGVGVGLGLQSLVNSLVSGIIIAFEKPVNVGDFIEVSGQSGTMKSIGFRSSVISSSNGADIVIPNGDLLAAHVVNWTRGGGKKLIEIVIGIAYGTDLEKTKQIVLDLLKNDERILKFPDPTVLFQEFAGSSINIKISFWVRDFRTAAPVKSDVVALIDTAFKNSNIVIPFPQQDIHVHTISNTKQDLP